MVKLATICYLDNGRQLLMLHRNKKENDVHEGKWISVGGKLEAGETPEACAIREIEEETGLKVQNPQLRGIITFPNFTPGHDWYCFVFKVYDFSGQLTHDSPEGALEWVDYTAVPDKPTWQGDYQITKWIMDDSPFFSATFVYDGEELLESSVIFHENTK